jgi:hypothetical protein
MAGDSPAGSYAPLCFLAIALAHPIQISSSPSSSSTSVGERIQSSPGNALDGLAPHTSSLIAHRQALATA